jgi:hypothetical protein
MSHQRYAGVPTPGQATSTAPRQPAPELRRALLERALTRRQLLRTMAGATGAALATGAWLPAAAHRGPHGPASAPRPIPGGLVIDDTLIHVNNLGEGHDEATIFDFNGFLGSTFVLGQGTAGDGTRYGHFVDMRLMEGVYVGLDGKPHVETFAFI